MRCTKAQSYIITRLAGELSVHKNKSLQEHLQSCAACRDYEKEQIALDALLSGEQAPGFPTDLHTRIMSSIKASSYQPAHGFKLMMRQVPAAAAIVFSIFLGGLIGMKAQASETQNKSITMEVPASKTEFASFGENSILDEIAYGEYYE